MSFDLISDITRDEDTAFTFLQERGCIRRTAPKCNVCDKVMTWVRAGDGKKYVWRCPSHKGHKVSPRVGSFWQNSNLPLTKLLQLAFFWSYSIPNKTCEEFTGVQTQAVVQWYQHFRDVCSDYFEQNPIRIGGPNVIVELGESVIAKQKHKMGRLVPERWVFGGICPATQEGFLLCVPDREAATLLPIIEEHVLPGSIIHTDGWASYDGIARINVQPLYIHHTVNCSINSVDPVRGASTKHVGKYLQKAKRKFKAMCGVQRNFVDSYLDEFRWRQKFGKNGLDAFNNLLLHISQWYPTP